MGVWLSRLTVLFSSRQDLQVICDRSHIRGEGGRGSHVFSFAMPWERFHGHDFRDNQAARQAGLWGVGKVGDGGGGDSRPRTGSRRGGGCAGAGDRRKHGRGLSQGNAWMKQVGPSGFPPAPFSPMVGYQASRRTSWVAARAAPPC
jgi:hypothetical protein